MYYTARAQLAACTKRQTKGMDRQVDEQTGVLIDDGRLACVW